MSAPPGPRPEGPQEAPAPERILAAVKQSPGLCVQDLAQAVGLSRTAVLYHARRLAKRGHLVMVRRGRRLAHFPASIRDAAQHTLLGLMHLRTARLLLERLAEEPTMSWRGLGRSLGITPRAVRWHVHRLRQDGLLEVHDAGGARHVTVLDGGLRAILDAPPSSPAPVPPPEPDLEVVMRPR